MNERHREVAGSRLRRMAAGETIAIIGLGASGESAARLALAKGARVHVTDASNEAPVAARGAALRDLGAEVRLGGHVLEEIVRANTIVVSPGISPASPVLSALRERGLGWISEPEFACRFLPSALIVVTGTNGKTTTASMCAALLRHAGVAVALGGNVGAGIGPPASALAMAAPAPEWVVLELSSFQLAGIRELTPKVGVMTNLGSDHLDRYGTLAAYHRDKRRLFEAGNEGTTWVLNGDDPAVLKMARGFPGTHLTFSVEDSKTPGAYLGERRLIVAQVGGQTDARSMARVEDVQLLGRHNLANAMAAGLAAVAAGADAETLGPAFRSFTPLPHRLEPAGTVDGVRWVNDSKATNVAATASALRSLEGPVVLLLGGTDKGESFAPILGQAAGRIRAVVAYGAAGTRAARDLAPVADPETRVERSRGTFADAVAVGQSLAEPGDTLLLSPACSSFDMFENYEARGDAFRGLARRTDSVGSAGPARKVTS